MDRLLSKTWRKSPKAQIISGKAIRVLATRPEIAFHPVDEKFDGEDTIANTRDARATQNREFLRSCSPDLISDVSRLISDFDLRWLRFVLNRHHPADAELVFKHSEFGRSECLLKRHCNLPAVSKRVEDARGFFFVRRDNRK